MNKTNVTGGAAPGPGVGIQLDDEDDFAERDVDKWNNVQKIVVILYDVNIAFAIIQSVIGLLLFLTILDKNLRGKSQMWYLYHLTLLVIFTGLFLHPFAHGENYTKDKQSCYFLMYSAEYIFFGVGMNVILVNLEIFFTKILTLQKWESNPFYRFLMSMALGWLIVCMIISHVIINNNYGSQDKYKFCFVLKDLSVRRARIVFRALIPAIVCFLFLICTVVTYYLKRSRITFTTMTGELKEIRTESRDDESQWLMCQVFINIVYLTRALTIVALHFNGIIRTPDEYLVVVFVIFVHVQTLYTLPFCMFFIYDVRQSLKCLLLKVIQKLSFGKLRVGDDLENLAVSFGNPSHVGTD
ncbi:uncharacterized protein LOC132756033 isoform X2 [Ruditapes philippinarum]|nr:uncharacterized protein LOC132756033 isoform X2 [Ruditapes philippinarum]